MGNNNILEFSCRKGVCMCSERLYFNGEEKIKFWFVWLISACAQSISLNNWEGNFRNKMDFGTMNHRLHFLFRVWQSRSVCPASIHEFWESFSSIGVKCWAVDICPLLRLFLRWCIFLMISLKTSTRLLHLESRHLLSWCWWSYFIEVSAVTSTVKPLI